MVWFLRSDLSGTGTQFHNDPITNVFSETFALVSVTDSRKYCLAAPPFMLLLFFYCSSSINYFYSCSGTPQPKIFIILFVFIILLVFIIFLVFIINFALSLLFLRGKSRVKNQ